MSAEKKQFQQIALFETREVNEHCVVHEERGSSCVSIWALSNNSLLFQIQGEMQINSGCHTETTSALDRGEGQGYVPDGVM